MAKMFYTLQEAADRLGKSEQEVKDMAADGQLQQFRDRDKLMFKVDQVDALTDGASGPGASGTSIPLADTDDTGGFTLKDDTAAGADPNEETGVSVFSPDEVEHADPMAQTRVTSHDSQNEDLQLESVGSGSGLLDLTRESDDTSLGAELLDEIYPGGGEQAADSGVGTSGVFEGSLSETGASGPSGLENLQGAGATAGSAALAEPTGVMPSAMLDDGDYDPAWSGFTAGALVGVTAALILALIVVAAAIVGSPSALATMITGSMGIFLGVVLGLLVLSFVLGAIGMVIGKNAG